jgi:hypothetical protein
MLIRVSRPSTGFSIGVSPEHRAGVEDPDCWAGEYRYRVSYSMRSANSKPLAWILS